MRVSSSLHLNASLGLASLLCLPGLAHAEAPVSGTGSLLQVVLGLSVVLLVMMALAWLAKRYQLSNPHGGSVARVVGGVSVGTRERVVVIEVGERWLVVGVAAGQVSSIANLAAGELTGSSAVAATPLQGSFAARFKQALGKVIVGDQNKPSQDKPLQGKSIQDKPTQSKPDA
ncbi:flagellar biosynthetic protein FliO [Pseudomethylobacillus aquaticus]|uniref:Flagellar protein n=1 Tax=Pseudomethylobacillus aquaticus TaxID=2676064 RepID=A0A3N0V0W6_9PROT|nr:flagellar biosynthetic protein FliO [Pseudomethylobacillus aquaticus]ROH86363.1 flagellar biosynthetic protein FliO [Pseudomethylobacillus aquaticus]